MTVLRAARAWIDRGDGTPDKKRMLVHAAVCYGLFIATWVPVNAYSVGRDAATLYLPGESSLPFVPEFEYLYAFGYVLPVIGLLNIPTVRGAVRVLIAFLLTLVVAYATYLVFPVYLERPDLVVDSLATFLLSLEYKDPSYNHFPSLHVTFVWLGYFASRSGLRRPWIYAVFALGVTASTMLVKQHYFVDLVYGFGLAWVTWIIAGRLEETSR
jgi:membrane-associated phospholipid phosphatase